MLDPAPLVSRRIATLLLALLALGVVLRLPTFARPLLSDDEAIYAATADAMSRGAVLYRDVVDHKPPAIYFIYRAGFALFGPFDMTGAHLFVVLAVLATALGLFVIARAGPGGARAGLVAAATALIFSTTWHDYDMLAANCELFLLVPETLAAVLLLRAPPSEPRLRFGLRHVAVGVLVALAALCKYQGVVFLGASFALLFLLGAAATLPWRWVAVGALCELVGLALPLAGYLGYAQAVGGRADTLAWFRFNFSYIGAGLTGAQALVRGLGRLGMIGAMALPLYGAGLTGAVRVIARFAHAARANGLARGFRAADPRDGFLMAWLLAQAVALSAGGRFFGHYFHLVLPPLSLLAAPVLLQIWDGPGRRSLRRAGLVLATAVPALLFFALATVARPLAQKIDHVDPDYGPVAARIAAQSAPDERLFVWGNTPQLYILARRSMGTRFSFCNYMTGESPGTGTETGAIDAETNSLAVSWDMLFQDLEIRRPALFVDAAAAGWDGYEKFPVGRYPRLETYLREHYRPISNPAGESGGNVVIYRRFP